MLYDVYMLTLWLVIALALGGIVGWATFSAGRRQPWFSGWFRAALIVFAVGLVLAVGHFITGRTQFWLEVALLAFAAYVVGAFLGGALRGVTAPPWTANSVDRPSPVILH